MRRPPLTPWREGRRLDGLAPRTAGRRCRRAGRTARVDPYAVADPTGVTVWADRLHDADAVAMRDDLRERHGGPKPAAPLLGIAGVDAGRPHPHPDLARSRLRC